MLVSFGSPHERVGDELLWCAALGRIATHVNVCLPLIHARPSRSRRRIGECVRMRGRVPACVLLGAPACVRVSGGICVPPTHRPTGPPLPPPPPPQARSGPDRPPDGPPGRVDLRRESCGRFRRRGLHKLGRRAANFTTGLPTSEMRSSACICIPGRHFDSPLRQVGCLPVCSCVQTAECLLVCRPLLPHPALQPQREAFFWLSSPSRLAA
ncbi:unnamed protein product [Protopolystoma xenopodis]|uniref:Uncharacterized protein n=1 Tax=Protopolystoma xenopodis TaxID=117903 RepID=A0A3S5CPS2_9PLAT|nr:unnamed protein product [Protopolystoma xenopodis]